MTISVSRGSLAGCSDARYADERPRLESLEPRALLSIGFIDTGPMGGGSEYVVADFDANGFGDIAATWPSDRAQALTVRLADGSGGFAESYRFDPGAPPLALNIAAADFDDDGDVDILANGFRLFRNDGAGGFADPEILSIDSVGGSHSPQFFRYDDDPYPDLVRQDSDGTVIIYRNVNGESLAPGVVADTPMSMHLAAPADMDASGIDDLVMRDDHGVVVYLADGSGGYTPGPRFEVALSNLTVADLNGDAYPDLVWAQNGVHAALNHGDGSFELVTPSPSSDASIVRILDVADFNADGTADVLSLRRVGIGQSSELVVSLATEPGRFQSDGIVLYEFSIGHASATAGRFADPGARTDVLLFLNPGTISRIGVFRLFIDADGPLISDFAGQEEPLIPGHTATFTLTAHGMDDRAIREVRIYRDADGDGVFNSLTDALVGSATRESPGPPSWTVPVLAPDGVPAGTHRFFAVAFDEARIRSDSLAADSILWTRVSSAEGWRNDTTINEYVPIVNPNPFPVEYRLFAHYEVGHPRDHVVAEGFIPAFSRGGVTITEHANPGAARVRLNEAYALELQSSAFLGAMLSHYDRFSEESGVGGATGEAFTNAKSTTWHFADASTADAAFLVLFNPLETGIELTIRFYDEQGVLTTRVMDVGPLRRSGLALRDPALALLPDTRYAIEVISSSPVIAALSSYSMTHDDGFTALGQALTPDGVAAFPLVEFRDQVQNRLTLFNSSIGRSVMATVQITWPGTANPTTMLSYLLDPLQRRIVNLDEMRPVDASLATLRVQGEDVRCHLDSVDVARGDSVVATPASRAFTVWAFADGFLDRNTAGTVGFETLALFNPSESDANVQIRFLFTDGTFIDQHIMAGAGSTSRLQLDQDPSILDHAQLNFYSIMVYSSTPIVASMIHWDLFQGGGWASLGTPGGRAGEV